MLPAVTSQIIYTEAFLHVNKLRLRQNGWHFADDILNTFLDWNSLKFVPKSPVCNKPDKGLALNRQQAIIWTNDGPVHWHIYVSLGLNEFI